MAGAIRIGIGGWTFPEWRGVFYPDGLPQKRELEYASRKLTSIEINATFYGSQKPESFARWRDETPDEFVFSVKAPRAATHRRVLAEAGQSVDWFFRTGVAELKAKLGPINWQLPPTKKFDPADIDAFLKLLPPDVDGVPLRHALEVRHASFASPEFVEILRTQQVAVVVDDKEGVAQIPDVAAPFVYARLQRTQEEEETGYPKKDLDLWAARALAWSRGETPKDLKIVGAPERKPPKSRDVFVYMISGFKQKAPAAALALIERVEAKA